MKEEKPPTLPKTRRVGHPQRQRQSPHADSLKWYHQTVKVSQLGNSKACATRPVAQELEAYKAAVEVVVATAGLLDNLVPDPPNH
jgi:hypothetical protein